MSIGLPSAAPRGQELAQAVAAPSRAARRRPRRRAWQASAQRMPGPPPLVTIATRSPRRNRLRRRAARRRRTARCIVSVRITPGLLEQRVDGHVGGRQQRAGVRGGGARARGRAAALDRQHRLCGRHPRARCARTCGGCRTTPGRAATSVGVRVLLPVLEEVVARQVGLVADRDERRQPDAEAARRLDDRDPEAAALRHEADRRPATARAARTSRSAGRRRRC